MAIVMPIWSPKLRQVPGKGELGYVVLDKMRIECFANTYFAKRMCSKASKCSIQKRGRMEYTPV